MSEIITSNSPTIPYTYYIEWSTTGHRYYGVRYAKGCHPDDLFVTYFTSSEHVANYILKNGLPDIIKVRRTFPDASSAISWEHKILKKMRVIHRNDYLNKTDNKAFSPECHHKKRGRTKANHPGVASRSKLIIGRTKETHAGVASMAKIKSQRNKSNHAGVRAQAEKISSSWIVHSNNDSFVINNLSQWCRDNGMRRASIYESVKHQRAYRGFVFTPVGELEEDR